MRRVASHVETQAFMRHEEALAALYHVIPAQAGIQAHPQRADYPARSMRHRARCGAVWVPAFAGTTQGVKLMPTVVYAPVRRFTSW